MGRLTAREALHAYAAAAARREEAKLALRQAEEALQRANQEAVERLAGAEIVLPVTATLSDGRTVTISDVAEDYNYHLEYTIAQAL